ncbi:MAG: leucine-rich repeat domain-containing protein, partial [Ruminococcaceae bacterium]|nr:leucine-rich repeat domain-containing protein [Oscillospiraceae bacterium]
MKRMFKPLFLILVISLMTAVLLGLCISAEESEQISASGYFGELNWRFSKDTSTLTISGEGRMIKPPSYDYWYTYAPFVRYVVIEEGAENISGDILSHCNMLDWVIIPDSVKEIDENALYLSDLLIIKCNYGSYAASYAEDNGITAEYLDIVASGKCGTNVTWVLDDKGTLTVSGKGSMYSNVYLSPFLKYRKQVINVVIKNGVTSIGKYAFEYHENMKSITIPPSVKVIVEYAFDHCSSLDAVYISDMASWCGIEFVSNNTSNPLSIAHKLYLNGELVEDLVIPEGVERIEEYAFKNFSSISSVTLPKSLKYVGIYAFYGCSSVKSVHIKDLKQWCGIDFEYALCYDAFDLYLNGELVTDLVIPEDVEFVTHYAFYNVGSITSVTIPENVKSMGFHTFDGCANLKDISISDECREIRKDCFTDTAFYLDENNWDNGVLYIDKHLIAVKSELTGSYAIRPGTLTIAENAFYGSNFESVTMPDSVVYITMSAFSYSKLNDISLSNSITRINDMTFVCSTLKSVKLPDNLIEIGFSAFEGTNLTSVVFPDSLEKIEGCAFLDCYYLKDITINKNLQQIGSWAFYYTAYYHSSANWRGPCLYLGDWLIDSDNMEAEGYLSVKQGTKFLADDALANCTELYAIKLPEGITVLPRYAFSDCFSLTEFAIPDSVTDIKSRAFIGCSNLKCIYIPENVTYIAYDAFDHCYDLTIYCQKGSYAEEYAVKYGIPVKYVIAKGECGEYINWYLSEEGILEILGSGYMYENKRPSSLSWEAYKDDITKVIIGDGVLNIATAAFYEYENLKEVDFGNTVISIGAYAFYGASSLDNIVFPDSCTTIGGSAFAYVGAQYITLPKT